MIIDKGNKMAVATKSGEPLTIRVKINPKARRLILRVDDRQRDAIAVAPHKRMLPDLYAFAQERADWLQAQLQKLPQVCVLADDTTIMLRGMPCQLSMAGSGRKAQLNPGPPLTLSLPGDPETFGRRALRYLKSEARKDLTEATQRHSERLGIKTGRISIKDTRSRWGSCTANGDLSYSWRLIMAPSHVLDYVAAHECAHRLEMNHSRAFWAHVEHCRPD